MRSTPYTLQVTDTLKMVSLQEMLDTDALWEPYGEDTPDAARRTLLRSKVGLVHRCLNIRRDSILVVPWQIVRGDTPVWISGEPPPKELEAFVHLSGLFALTEASLVIRNEAFWQITGDKQNGLKWLAPKTVTPHWDGDAGLVGFSRKLGGGRKPVPLETDEVVYIWRQDPEHETLPDVSVLDATLAQASVAYGRDVFENSYFRRGASRAMLLGVSGDTQKDERDELESWFTRFLSGVGNAFRTKVVNSDRITPITIGDGLDALAKGGLDQQLAASITMSMGVPLSMLQGDAANYATAEENTAGFWTTTILPDCYLIETAVNDQLLQPLGYRLQFLPERMDVFQVDEQSRSGSLLTLAQAYSVIANTGTPELFAAFAEILGFEIPDDVQALITASATQRKQQETLERKLETQEQELRNLQLAQQEGAAASAPVTSPNGGPPPFVPDTDAEPNKATRDSIAWRTEAEVFMRWCARRDDPDVRDFRTNILTDLDKLELRAYALNEKGAAYEWRTDWDEYP